MSFDAPIANPEVVYVQGAETNMPIAFGRNADDVLRRAHDSYTSEADKIRTLVDSKRELVLLYDIDGMTRTATILHGGSTGSVLAASFLDNHPDIVMLPMLTSTSIYQLYHDYPNLSVWEKLVAYPPYSVVKQKSDGDLFLVNNPTGKFAISPADFYASIQALFDVYGDRPADWLNARPRFFQFLHVAYTAALGRRLENSRPLMLYAQHWVNDELAERYIEDFPSGKFIHTVRDPISGLDSWFERKSDMALYDVNRRPESATAYFDSAVSSTIDITSLGWDRPHRGMELRTRALRFEDMHLALEPTMRRMAEWLDILFESTMLQSSWNGIPWVVTIRGVSWCGSNPANARRRWRNMDVADRLTMFALMQENFKSWAYPIPKFINSQWKRLCIIAVFWLLPTKMECINAGVVLRLQALPNLRQGRIAFAFGALFFLLKRRLRMMWLIAAQTRVRVIGRRPVATVL
jgi:hypothetical protein